MGIVDPCAVSRHRQGDCTRCVAPRSGCAGRRVGVDPGPEMRELESAVLAQEQSLFRTPESAQTSGRAGAGGRPRRPSDRTTAGARHPDRVRTRTAGLITGEPGVGKSAVARAACVTARALGLRTGWGPANPPAERHPCGLGSRRSVSCWPGSTRRPCVRLVPGTPPWAGCSRRQPRPDRPRPPWIRTRCRFSRPKASPHFSPKHRAHRSSCWTTSNGRTRTPCRYCAG